MAYLGPYQIYSIDGEEIVSRVLDWRRLATSINNAVDAAAAAFGEESKAIRDKIALVEGVNTDQSTAIATIKEDNTEQDGRLSTLERDKWLRPSVAAGSGQDANDLRTSGFTGVLAADTANLPVAQVGFLEVFVYGAAVTQRYTTYEAVSRQFIRVRWGAGGWAAWGETSVASALKTTALDATTDVDTLVQPGTYGALLPLNMKHLPVPAAGLLEVFAYGTGVTQRYTTYEAMPRMFARSRWGGGGWGDWREVAKERPDITSAGDLDTVTLTGTYGVTGVAANLPIAKVGTLEVMRVNRALIQRYTTWDVVPSVYVRRSTLDVTGWESWQKQAGQADIEALNVRVDGAAGTSAGTGFKQVPLALNQPGGGGTESVAADALRWPVTLGVTSRRARLHIRNWNWVTGTVYTGAVAVTGVWIGRGTGKTFQSAPQRVLSAFSTPAGGSEYVSEWFAYDFAEDVQHLVSLGYTTAAGQTNYQGRGACWRFANPGDASTIDPASAGPSSFSPFDVWLEMEVPASTPVLAGFGDSNTVGTGTTLPMHDSWLAQYCRQARAFPFFLANHGSLAATWGEPGSVKWNRFLGLSKPDAAVYFLHRNDLQPGITLDVMKDRFRSVLDTLRAKITPNVYAATITPKNADTDEVQAVRVAFNTWLKTRPEGVRDCFDFSAAVSDDDRTIRPVDDHDGLHYKTTAHAKIAAKLLERPVTPRVLTQAEVGRLVA